MKKTILFLSILITMFVKAEAQNDAMYVYRNDGKVNAFSRSEIDSMTYSHYDADSIYHNEWQAQIVYMADCVYYIPLEVIDSIRFAAPEAKCSCPDDNHPHAIDLGLPSGTKWCCCNVGASSPEEYGGYYAWGETTEKSVYDLDTYAYYKDDSCVYIGSDISGTQYDVACVRMGAPWRMPTFEQQDELVTCCKRSWTQKNGVQGILVTGPNDAQVQAIAGMSPSALLARPATIGPVRFICTAAMPHTTSTSLFTVGAGATTTATTVGLYGPFARSYRTVGTERKRSLSYQCRRNSCTIGITFES